MNSTLAERLKVAMQIEPGHTAADLARACKVKAPSVSGWLSGESKKMDAANLLTVARLCKVSPDWLCFGTGAMQRAAYWPFTRELHARVEQLDDDMTDKCENFLRTFLDMEALPPAQKKGNGLAA